MDFKVILPLESYTLISTLSAEEIRKGIADNIAPKQSNRFYLPGDIPAKNYHGKIAGDHFEISRNIQYRNSFLPIVTGHISSPFGQTIIKITMQPSIAVVVFMCVWFGIVGIACLQLLTTGSSPIKTITKDPSSYFTFIPLVMLVVGWLVVLLGFKCESKKAKQFFATLLEAEQMTKAQATFFYNKKIE